MASEKNITMRQYNGVVTLENNILSWYNAGDNVADQCNSEGATYYYIATS